MKKKVTTTELDKIVKKKSMKVPICRNSLPPPPHPRHLWSNFPHGFYRSLKNSLYLWAKLLVSILGGGVDLLVLLAF